MNTSISSALFFGLVAQCLAFVGVRAQDKTFKATDAQKIALKTQADEIAAAMMKQDYAKLAYYTYPAVEQQLGGKEKMIAKLKEAMAQMKNNGATFNSVSIGNINEIVKSGRDLYCIVPDILQISANGTLFTQGSYLLAVSHNQGVRWYFVDTAPLKRQNIKVLFPTFPAGMVIPEVQKPGFMRSQN